MNEAAALKGLKRICVYEGVSEPTLRLLIEREGYPAVKIMGVWHSDAALIEDWRRERIRGVRRREVID